MSRSSSRKNDAAVAQPVVMAHKQPQPRLVTPFPSRAHAHQSGGMEGPRLFLIAIAVLVAVLIVWASLAPVDRVVRVEGAVIPAGHSQQIQHLEGGIIASIDTVEGASVKRGDLLMTINDTLANADMTDAKDKLNAARTRVIRLQAETQNKDKVDFPPDLAGLPVATAEQSLFMALRQKLDEEIAVHQNTIKQRQDDIIQAQQQQSSLTAEMATAQQRLTMEQTMAAQGAASRMEVLDAQSRVQQLKTQIDTTAASIPRFKAAIAEEQARIQTAKASFSSQAHDDLVTALQDVDRYRQAIATTSDRLRRTDIRAPIDGVINHIYINTVGGVVKPGETLIDLTPGSHEILIEAKALPRDRGYLRVGLPAQIRVSAYDSAALGLLRGQVTGVGADSIEDAHGNPYYEVDILVKSLPPSYAAHVIVPGMTVTADIVTGRRTILDYLLSPVSKFTYNMFRDPR
ncbi:MAG: HlyD family type I secretion periplasmic adaptor subunit [Alphaproteobacteria bacterium]|nr:HlyD family type I secretion periplasmic adaptor subunit [Alphaproteobacteria bacterium]